MNKQFHILKGLLMVFCLLMTTPFLFSQKIEKKGLQITPSTINHFIDDYACITTTPSSCGFTLENSKFYTKLEFTGDNKKHYSQNWELKVTYTLTLYDQNGNTYPITTPQILKIDWDKDNSYQDIDYIIHKSTVSGIKYIGADINISQVDFIDKATSSPMPYPIASDMVFSVNIESNKNYPISVEPIVTYNQTTSYNATKNELTLNWDFVPHATGYELEVLPIDIGIADISSTDFDYDFQNAIRIRTNKNSHKLPMAFPRSLLIFRVRPFIERENANGGYDHIDGGFTALPSGKIMASTGHEYMQYRGHYNPPHTDNRTFILDQKAFYWPNDPLINPLAGKTWQYSVSYAEEGKSRQAITFYDNIMTPTQSVTLSNTDETAIVQTTTQDFIGRPAVSIMPSPLKSQGIRFYDHIALSSNATSPTNFNYRDFDLSSYASSSGTINTFQNPLAIDAQNSTGSANYYSNFRTLTGINTEYIPEANGYTYARTKFTRDGTNRPISQSGIGNEIGPASGKTTDYYYASTNKSELERLFGNNVGIASNYKKNMIVDPNGQASVSYIDGSGRTIATGLSGGSTNGNLYIDSKPEEDEFPFITEDFSDNNKPSGKSKVISTKTILCQSAFNYKFTYNLPAEAYTNCLTGNCNYDLTIYITNTRTGERINLTNQSGTNTSTTNKITEKLSSGVTIIFYADLKVGTYQITKEIELSSSDLSSYYNTYISQNDPLNPPQSCYTYCPPNLSTDCNSCIENCENKYIRTYKTHDYLTNMEIIKKSYYNDNGDEICYQIYDLTLTPCDFGPIIYVAPFVSTDKQAIDLIIQTCSTSCITPEPKKTACEAMYERLKDDVSPLGQYFDNLPDLGDPNYNTKINDWLSSSTTNPNRNLAYFNSNNGVSYVFTDWDDVRTKWNPDWADIMLEAHPEFCAFENYCCVIPQSTVPESYQVFDRGIHTTTSAPESSCDLVILDDNSNAGNMYHHAFSKFLVNVPASSGTPATYFSLNQVANPSAPGGITSSHPDYNKFHGSTGIIGTAAWQMTQAEFIAHYNNLFSQKAKYDLANANCNAGTTSVFPLPGITGNHHITSGGFEIRYPFIDWNISSTSTTQTSLTACETYCESSADVWISNFKCASAINDPLYPNDLSKIKQALIKLCKNSECNSLGYVPTTVALVLDKNSSTTTVTNFQDVFNAVRSAYNMQPGACPTPDIDPSSTTYDETCGCTQVLSKAMAHSGLQLYELPPVYTGLPKINSNDLEHYLFIQSGSDPNSSKYSIAYDGCMQNIKFMDPLSPPVTLPSLLDCPVDNGITLIDQCQSNLNAKNATKTAFYMEYYKEFIKTKAQNWINNYSSTCIDNVMNNESFTYGYKLKEYHYTLYFYDQAGNLVKTVAPEGVYQKKSPTSFDETTDLLNRSNDILAHRQNPSTAAFVHPEYAMHTNYQYNSLNQLTEQTTPDGGTSKFFYDYLGRLIASQNAEQIKNDAYSYTVYDGLGRIIEVGELINPNVLTKIISRTNIPTTSSPTSWNSWKSSATSRNEIVKTYYNEAPTFYSYDPLENLRNRIACIAKFKNASDADNNVNPVSSSYYSYDYIGNVKKMIQHNDELTISGNLNPYKTINYKYDLISGNVTQVTYQKGYDDQFIHKYEYDADDRLTISYTSKDGTVWEKESKNLYYPHGPLARLEIGDKQVQGLDYAYTIQGWLKTVNSSTSNHTKDIGMDGASGINQNFGRDAFGYSLHYFSGDYQNTGGNDQVIADLGAGQFSTESPNLFNGNISKMVVGLTDHNENKAQVIGNTYKYDQLNRLKNYTPFLSQDENIDHIYNDNSLDPSGVINNRYVSNYDYDGNGNIIKLDRKGSGIEWDDPTDHTAGFHHVPEDMDEFTYKYLETKSTTQNGSAIIVRKNNRLEFVDDPIGNPYTTDLKDQSSGNYAYDDIGRLIMDKEEEIEHPTNPSLPAIEWNVANKITKIYKKNGDLITFSYDPMGNRISKTSTTSGGFYNTTFYVRDAQGNVIATYKKSNEYIAGDTYSDERFSLSDFHLYGSSRIGTKNEDLVLYDIGNNQPLVNYDYSHRVLGDKRYELSNHLGNVLEVISDRTLTAETGIVDGVLSITASNPDVISYSDYYPFGMLMPNRRGSDVSHTEQYAFGYQGSEKDGEVNESSYGTYFRQLDSRIGRWLSIDPVTHEHMTPYNSMDNNPIVVVDPTGADGWLFGLWGSTKEQRMTARATAAATGGEIKNNLWRNISVEYSINERIAPTKKEKEMTVATGATLLNPVAVLAREQYFNQDGSLGILNDGAGNPLTIQEAGKNKTAYQTLDNRFSNSPNPINRLLWTVSSETANSVYVFGANFVSGRQVTGLNGKVYTKGTNEHLGTSLEGMGTLFSGFLSGAKNTIQGAASVYKNSSSSSTALANYYPPNNGGFNTTSEFLYPGTVIDRFGRTSGRYFSPGGTPSVMRALSPSNTGTYGAYQVMKPFPVQSSTISSWFGKMGFGKQYLSPLPASTLIKKGIIKPL